MANSWLKAAGESAVPTAFLVNEDGYILWIGHPGELDEIIAQFKNKTLRVDLDARKRAQALQRLELDPTLTLDPHIFSTLFNIKPPAIVYVDDRAVCFTGNFDKTLDEILHFRTHWEHFD